MYICSSCGSTSEGQDMCCGMQKEHACGCGKAVSQCCGSKNKLK